jgi:hypothetical protein
MVRHSSITFLDRPVPPPDKNQYASSSGGQKPPSWAVRFIAYNGLQYKSQAKIIWKVVCREAQA